MKKTIVARSGVYLCVALLVPAALASAATELGKLSPPIVLGDRVLFGCNDGYVYSLRTEDEALAWRFRAAPHERRIVVDDRLESPWPVGGSVLTVRVGSTKSAGVRRTDCRRRASLYVDARRQAGLLWQALTYRLVRHSAALASIIRLNRVGTRTSVNAVETTSPPSTTAPRPR